jgi:hypothetical protein
MSLTIRGSLTTRGGVTIGVNSAGPTPDPGVNNVVGYNEMPPPVIPSNQLEDGSATVNGSVGFTINNDGATGVAFLACTASNILWFDTNYTVVPGTYTCTWGPGSTVASSPVYVQQLPSYGALVFFIGGQVGAATYNYPFTFSV